MKARLKAVARAIAFNQAIALPVALIMGASNGHWVPSLVVATAFSQCVGALCWTSARVLAGRIISLERAPRMAAWLSLYFADGVVGAAIARQFCVSVLGYNMGGQYAIFSLAIGASIAVLVGVAMVTMHELRASLEESQQALRDRELEDARLRQAKTDAELSALQARINPHFLFNTLNSIAALISEDPAKAEEATWQLSSLFRYTLQANTRSAVTVEEELTIVRRYLEIEKIRLAERLEFNIVVDPDLASREIPALLLQPLVENAIKHGIAPQVKGGVVEIVGRRIGNEAVFTITDNGSGTASESGAGVGMDNVRRRLETLYGASGAIAFGREGDLTVTRVTIPL
jgi:two-component system, LytTR family, sensor kinase